MCCPCPCFSLAASSWLSISWSGEARLDWNLGPVLATIMVSIVLVYTLSKAGGTEQHWDSTTKRSSISAGMDGPPAPACVPVKRPQPVSQDFQALLMLIICNTRTTSLRLSREICDSFVTVEHLTRGWCGKECLNTSCILCAAALLRHPKKLPNLESSCFFSNIEPSGKDGAV